MNSPKNTTSALRLLGGALLFLAAALVIYWPALNGGYILDDLIWVQNTPVLKSFHGLGLLWQGKDLPDFFPLTSTSFWLEWQFWDGNRIGFHLTNVVLHVGSGFLLWRVLAQLKIPGAFVVALIFLVHPVNVESVAWISERKNTLCMVFYLLSLWFYFKSERMRDFILSLVLFLLALLSKTSVVTLPVVLLGCAWWQKGKIERRDWLRCLPFFGLAILLGVVTVWFQSHNAIGKDEVLTASFPARLASAGRAVWFYLGKSIWPQGLIFVYPRWTMGEPSLASFFPTATLVILAVVLWCYRKIDWVRTVIFGLGYFALTLAPVLGFVNIYYFKYSMVADHWLYFSIVSIIALVVGGVYWKVKNAGARIGFAVVVVLIFVLMSRTQAKLYGDPKLIWTDTVEKNSESWMAHELLGHYLGNTPEAAEHFRKSIELNSSNSAARVNLGMLLQGAGFLDQALEQYREAKKITPDTWAISFNLGALYDTQGKDSEAEAAYREVIRLQPNYAPAHNYLGTTLMKLGKKEEAAKEFKEALRLDPGNAEARDNLEKSLR